MRKLKNEHLLVTSAEGLVGQASLPSNFMEILGDFAIGYRVHKVIDNLVTFKRFGTPNACCICKRHHDNDNSLMVLVGRRNYVVKCRRDASHRCILIAINSRVEIKGRVVRRVDVMQ